MKFRKIEILEKDSNKKGDLFGRLMSDLFHSLGYDEPRLNIHKSGREIDLQSFHRTEKKIAIAECKAHSDTIGGSDINKFVGAIDAEKRKLKKSKDMKGHSVAGYFISLSGFKETAIEQERDLDNNRIILIKPEKIVEELIRGRILVSIEKAISSILIDDTQITLFERVDLLAYDKGWVWALYYSNNKGQSATHFALVHAEGNPLIKNLADEVIAIDSTVNKLFNNLILLNNANETNSLQEQLNETEKKYFKYLENELGEIHFEGLPTDKEAGSVKVKLENIFVPLHLTKSQQEVNKNELEFDENVREGIGEILNKSSKLAILAKPGGGKSTLIKRIAIAYAYPERRNLINDKLPDKTWFPIFLRCRELGEKVTFSITDIINNIPSRAEISSCSNSFSILVSQSLQEGNALLLVDGLDEIAEDKNRIAFVNQLRTFIATYPTIHIILTSREAGFRVVAGSLATYCDNYTVSSLTKLEIEQLCLKWHKAVIDESENTVKEAKKLSELILKDNRIRVLAQNPLLLTTLLFVKRWAGYLPTKRSVLYQEMIKLLLVTWNVEGHEILDIDETEPQLAFVAYWMTKNGQQTISFDELNNCLIDARKQMPEILGYTKVSPSEFIRRVESRSSLLIMAGHKQLESGIIRPIYEFLHLSFQEYLTAKAIVKKFIPVLDSDNKVIEILKPYVSNENWKEVIPLVAVLLERDSKELIEYLITLSESHFFEEREEKNIFKKVQVPALLGSCLANEIQISPQLLERAIEWYAKNTYSLREVNYTQIILENKFGTMFRSRVRECFFEKYDDKFASALGSMLSEIMHFDLLNGKNSVNYFEDILTAMKGVHREERCIAILAMMHYAFTNKRSEDLQEIPIILNEIFTTMVELLDKNDEHCYFSICWCIAWAGDANIFPDNLRTKTVKYLINCWNAFEVKNLNRVTSWALSTTLMPIVTYQDISEAKNLKIRINEFYNKPLNEFDKLVAIYLGIITGETSELKDMHKILSEALSTRTKETSSLSQFAKKVKVKIKNVEQF
jgi:NACHT domain/Restriction endonuclease